MPTLAQREELRRIADAVNPPRTYDRSFPLADIQILRAGDGRTVEAYAAMFGAAYEVRDQHGHYMERIERSAFDQALRDGAGESALCLYNHGMSVVTGQPDSLAQIPLGRPLEIRADRRGLLTVTRYNRGPFTDQVLESIRNGDIRAQSFRGKIVRSTPNRVPLRRAGGPLPTVVRHQLGLSDYGPSPVPVNTDAAILSVRSRRFRTAADTLAEHGFASYSEWREWLRGEIARIDAPRRAERARIRGQHEALRARIRTRLAEIDRKRGVKPAASRAQSVIAALESLTAADRDELLRRLEAGR